MNDQVVDPTPEIIEALGRQAFDTCVLRARLRVQAQQQQATEPPPTPLRTERPPKEA